MATLDEEISVLKKKIEEYENDLKNISTEARKDLLYGLIKTRSDNLTELLKQKISQLIGI